VVVAPDGTIFTGSGEQVLRIHPDGHYETIFTMDRSMTNSPAVTAGGSIVLAPESGTVYEIDANGTLLWKYTTGEYMSVEASPVIGRDGTIYVGGRSLWAFTAAGSVKWTLPMVGYVAAPTAIASDGTLYTADAAGNLYSIDPKGSIEWSVGGLVQAGALALGDGVIYVNSHDNVLSAVGLDGRLLWRHRIATFVVDVAPSPGLGQDGTIYAVGGYGRVVALTPAGHVLWIHRVRRDVSDAVVDGTGTVYIADNFGDVYAIAPSGQVRWHYWERGGFALGGVVIVPGRIYANGASVVAIGAN
jgi:sugar lactone lactonase YvrE